ncbi:NAD-dependent epimerase/dehydratase family protein [Muricoccus radiodurans]|uniref:NAD-dependent epimerase/dehydratase family protein n=1 Tax=Muricoccus radiodurans TaxID=2231721 RepID=UPI003CED16AB
MTAFLVTGGAGFIGSHLSDALLRAGHRVRVLDDLSTGRRHNLASQVEFIEGDVADPAAVRDAVRGISGVFHLAAIASVARSNEDWLGTHRANQAGTVCVLDAARAEGRIPVVYASSAAIYGDQGDGPIREDAAPSPQTAYGADKLGSELHARVAASVHRVPTAGFRFFNVYGPRQDPSSPYSGVISIFAARIAARQGITIHGDGGQVRDFVFVADVVAHLIAGMRGLAEGAPRAEVFNVCTGCSTSILDLAATLAEVAGTTVPIRHGEARLGDIRTSLGDPSRAIAGLGVRALTPLRDGLSTLCGPALTQPLPRAA